MPSFFNARQRSAFLFIMVVTACPGVAKAQMVTTFNFDFNFVRNISSGSNYGELKGSFTATPSSTNSYLITKMSGTLGGYAVRLLAPNAFAGNDNRLFYPTNTGLFDRYGVSFVANHVNFNLYYSNGRTAITTVDSANYGAVYAGTVVEAVPSPVPGAGIWSWGGLCFASLTLRFRACLKWLTRGGRRIDVSAALSGLKTT